MKTDQSGWPEGHTAVSYTHLDKSLCMKGGIGSYAVQIGDLKVGAIVAVNARGDIYDWKDGKKVAGLLNADRKTFADTEEAV